MPEEIVPLEMVGKMVLDRNPDNFFAETEQVAFCPSHILPGIDFSEDPLLQGRLFSYLDTQLSRLGSSNFHEIPINRPKCPSQIFSATATCRCRFQKAASITSRTPSILRARVRFREDFALHPFLLKERRCAYGRNRLPIRRRILGHLDIIEPDLGKKVADNLGMAGQAEKMKPATPPMDLKPSPALRLYGKYAPTLIGRKVGVLLAANFDVQLKNELVAAIQKEGATAAIIAPKVGGVEDGAGTKHPAEMALAGSPSVLFDAVAVLAGPEGDKALTKNPDAIEFVMDACRHLKAIAVVGASGLAEKTQVSGIAGVVKLDSSKDIPAFLKFAREGRVWARETE